MPKVLTPEGRAKKKAASLRWYYEHREQQLAKMLAWTRTNKKHLAAYRKDFYKRTKQARVEHARTYRAANLEKITQKKRAWRQDKENRERENAQHRRWLDEHREQQRAYDRAFNAANKEKRKIKRDRHRANNPELYALYRHRRRAKIKGLNESHTISDWQMVLKAHGYRCVYCGMKQSKKEPLTRDHYIPLVNGGSNKASNLVPACMKCNVKKSRRDPIEFAQSLGRLL